MKMDNKLSIIGKTILRRDAFTKVTGQEKYAADYYAGNFLWAGVKRAGIPHARLHGIHTEKVLQVPGIAAILTHKDIKGSNRHGIIGMDEPVLADTKIYHCGDAVALILAENVGALKQAIEAITFDYEVLPGIFDPEEALKKEAPRVHEDKPDGNLIRLVSVKTGAGEDAFHECDTVIESVFETQRQEHAYLETEAGWAYSEDDGRIVIVASTQTPFRDCFEVARAIGVDAGRLRMIVPYLGGAFGGKDRVTVQCLLGIAALHSQGKPVKMWWNREESFLASVKRLPVKMYYKLGAKADGSLHALQCRLYFDGGAYATLGGEIMTLGIEHTGSAYRIPNVDINGWCIYTNNPPGGPFRGFGVPQVTAAMEQTMDILAEKLGMDPVAIRKKNIVRRNDKNCVGVTLTQSTGAVECLRVLSEHPAWKERDEWKASSLLPKIRGVGIACMAHAMGYPPAVPDTANAKIELTEKGKIRVYAGVVDMGQGNVSTYLQITAHILNQEIDDIELVLPDTAQTLPSGGSSASRTTYTYGNALIKACEAMKTRILEKAASLRRDGVNGFSLAPGRVIHGLAGHEIPLEELCHYFGESERICMDSFTMPVVEGMNDVIYMGPHLIYSYGAHLACVEIDRLTGEIEVKSYIAVTDAGKVINPQVYEQQIQGAIAQGIGYALYEDYKVGKGEHLTPDLATYIIPTSMDIPEITSIPVETVENSGPFGMKGVGEIAMSGPVPAIANAVYDACGIRMPGPPFTAEKILKALAEPSAGVDNKYL
jgi:CO/xanthine dehydrogenase Mo-binding subunit